MDSRSGVASVFTTPNNLPSRSDTFIGRERDIQQLRLLLAEGRFVTLVGVAGGGKSRLAVETGTRLLDGYRDGVWLIRLRRISDSSEVLSAVADSIADRSVSAGPAAFLTADAGESLDRAVVDDLERREVLLILDGCEHVTAGVAAFAAKVFDRAPDVRILATSRHPIGVQGERLWHLPPLAVPTIATGEPVTAKEIADVDSVRLFVDRARSSDPQFKLTDLTAPSVSSICRRLDGLPLAIELAAARVGVLDLQSMADRLNEEFSLIVDSFDASADGQGTLGAALDWSYEHLSDHEKILFDRLSVFPGEFSVEAAEAVGGGEPVAPTETLKLLSGLVAKSMVIADTDASAQTRYRMLGIMRSHAHARLAQRGEVDLLRQRHAAYCERIVASLEGLLMGRDQRDALDQLEAIRADISAAVNWHLVTGDVAAALQYLSSLYWFWFVRRHHEGFEMVRTAIEMSDPGDVSRTPRAWIGGGLLALLEGHLDLARRWLQEGVEAAIRSDGADAASEGALYLGMLAQRRGQMDLAEERYSEALGGFRESGAHWGVAWSVWFLGALARIRGDVGGASERLEEALDAFRLQGDAFGTANSLAGLGSLARARGDPDYAVTLHREARTLLTEIGDFQGVADVTLAIGLDKRTQGDFESAESLFEEVVGQARSTGRRSQLARGLYLLGDTQRMAGRLDVARTNLLDGLDFVIDASDPTGRATQLLTLQSLGLLVHRGGPAKQAVTILSAAGAAAETAARPTSATRRAELDAAMTDLKAQIGEAAFGRQWVAGQSLTAADVALLVRSEVPDPSLAMRALTLDEVELGKRVASELTGIGERREVRLAGIRLSGRRRRPSGERAPLPVQLMKSGYVWLIVGLLAVAVWISLFAVPETADWWEARDRVITDWLTEHRTEWATTMAQSGHALGSIWFFRPIRWAIFAIVIASRRWRHLFGAIIAFVVLESVADIVAFEIGRPRPFTVIIGAWKGYSHPSGPVASLTVTLAVAGFSLFPFGRWRNRWMAGAGVLVALLGFSRVYLGVDHLTDVVVAAAIGMAVAVIVHRLLVPEEAFPVAYRRGRTAHLSIEGVRGEAIKQGMADQLGLCVLELQHFGLAASGGSTPIRVKVDGDPDTYLFAKLYSTTHLRSDRWYKAARTILYGSLEDEVRFATVRRLVEYEDYMLLLMQKAGVPSAESYGIVEITPEREYLIVTEFLDGAKEISDVEIDDSIIDDALLLIRRLWDAGLAHRDIKPANVMVQDGKIRLVDVAFGTVRPSPWRQAVDLANMMIILGLKAEPQRVYRRALRYFAPEDLAEAFAATRSVTIPSQSRSSLKIMLKTQGTDLIAEYRSLAPHREPIAIQRWSRRRIGLALSALVVGLLLVLLILENVAGRGFV